MLITPYAVVRIKGDNKYGNTKYRVRCIEDAQWVFPEFEIKFDLIITT